MCARAARQPWRSRDTASLKTAKNQKSRTGGNGRNVSATCKGTQKEGTTARRTPKAHGAGGNGSAESQKCKEPCGFVTLCHKRRRATRRRPFQRPVTREASSTTRLSSSSEPGAPDKTRPRS